MHSLQPPCTQAAAPTRRAGAALLPELNPEHLRTGLLLFHIFGVLWLAQLMQAIGYAAMSGAVSHWFFFRDQPSERQRLPVVGSLWRAVRLLPGQSPRLQPYVPEAAASCARGRSHMHMRMSHVT